jgi:hypothetical protein
LHFFFLFRSNSEVVISFTSKSNGNKRVRRLSSPVKVPNKPTPTILLTDFDGDRNVNRTPPQPLRRVPLSRTINDSSLADSVPKEDTATSNSSKTIVEVHDYQLSGTNKAHEGKDKSIYNLQNVQLTDAPREVCIDIEPPPEDEKTESTQRGRQDIMDESYDESTSNLAYSRSNSSSTSSLSSSVELSQELEEANSILNDKDEDHIEEGSGHKEHSILKVIPGPSEMDLAMCSLKVPGESQATEPQKKPANFLTGMSKTFHKWRTKTKKKKQFNYEKYIIYLESILPTVGFSVGGVIIDWNGIYTFIVIMTFLVGVFAQEAFFGN